MYEIMKALYDIGFDGPIRPDHGRMIWGEVAMPGYGLYDRALGATYFAGLATGVFKSKDEIKKLHQVEQIFMSRIDDEMRDKLIKGWKKAVDATLKFK